MYQRKDGISEGTKTLLEYLEFSLPKNFPSSLKESLIRIPVGSINFIGTL